MALYRKVLKMEPSFALRRESRSILRRMKKKGQHLDDDEDLVCTLRAQLPKLRCADHVARMKGIIKTLEKEVAAPSGSDDHSGSTTSSSSSPSSSSSEDEEAESIGLSSDSKYSLERIVGVRITRDSKREYLVRWAGYDSDDDTWEPLQKLVEDGCSDDVIRFHREIGKTTAVRVRI